MEADLFITRRRRVIAALEDLWASLGRDRDVLITLPPLNLYGFTTSTPPQQFLHDVAKYQGWSYVYAIVYFDEHPVRDLIMYPEYIS